LKRLARDYQELKNSSIPLIGVAGVPDENDMHKWHINVRAPEESPWKGAVFHMIMHFPKNYPIAPPKIKMPTSIIHPNVMTRNGERIICLEQLESQPTDQARWYEGWQSAYTVESILVQLQSFLMEVKL
jgi:ubiquitin-conjugating enzyme E2 G2